MWKHDPETGTAVTNGCLLRRNTCWTLHKQVVWRCKIVWVLNIHGAHRGIFHELRWRLRRVGPPIYGIPAQWRLLIRPNTSRDLKSRSKMASHWRNLVVYVVVKRKKWRVQSNRPIKKAGKSKWSLKKRLTKAREAKQAKRRGLSASKAASLPASETGSRRTLHPQNSAPQPTPSMSAL